MPECRSCKARVIWVKTEKGSSMPLDEIEDPEKGNIAVDDQGVGRVLRGSDLDDALAARVKLYTSHFATCPNAKKHRKAKT